MTIQTLVRSVKLELITRKEAQLNIRVDAQSTWHRLVKNKLLPSGIFITANSVRYVKSEIEAVKAARIAGFSNLEIQVLVVELEKNRQLSAREFLTTLNLKVTENSDEIN